MGSVFLNSIWFWVDSNETVRGSRVARSGTKIARPLVMISCEPDAVKDGLNC